MDVSIPKFQLFVGILNLAPLALDILYLSQNKLASMSQFRNVCIGAYQIEEKFNSFIFASEENRGLVWYGEYES